MYVFAFDRDWTVDVNPHPDRDAVPLAWVRTLAHDTEHAVYAIGNQTLADEAAIPGVVDIVGQHPDPWTDWLGEKTPDGRYERYPTRRERLELIRDLHPDADGYIVVDDLDLSDVPGWAHYHAWEFVPAIEREEVDLATSLTGEFVPDGGFDSPEVVETLLEAGVVFEVTHDADGEQRHQVVTHQKPTRPSMLPLRGPPVFWFEPIGGGQPFSVRYPDLLAIHPVAIDQLPDPLTDDALTAYRVTLATDSTKVDLQAVETILRQATTHSSRYDSDEVFALAVAAIDHKQNALATLIEPLLALLETHEASNGRLILDRIADKIPEDPTLFLPYTAELSSYLEAESGYRGSAARCLMELAEVEPNAVVDAVPLLATVADDCTASTREYVIYTLLLVARQYPAEVLPAIDVFVSAVRTGSENAQTNALAALGTITSQFPDATQTIVSDVAGLLEAESREARNNAVGMLGDIAQTQPGIVIEYADEIATRLDDPNIQARINASITLLRAGEASPDAIRTQRARLETALMDSSPAVRANTCVLIGNADVQVDLEALREVRQNDLDENVREQAAWALSRLRE